MSDLIGWEAQVFSEHTEKWIGMGLYRTRAEADTVAASLAQYRKRRVVAVRTSDGASS